MKYAGARQCSRHARLSGVNWYKPAAISSTLPSTELRETIIGDSNAIRSKIHCDVVAATLNTAQTATYPATKTKVGATGLCCAAALRATAAYMSAMGAADGTIMAIIIAAHIASVSANVAVDQGCTSVIARIP